MNSTRKLGIVAAMALAVAALPSVAPATDYYVRSDGSDAQAGTGYLNTQAWASIGHAVSTATVGDTVYIAPGSYSDPAGLAPANDTSWLGDPTSAVFLDVTPGTVTHNQTTNYRLWDFTSVTGDVSGITWSDMTIEARNYGAFWLYNNGTVSDLTLDTLDITTRTNGVGAPTGDAIVFGKDCTNVTINDCTVTTGRYAIVSNADFDNSAVTGNTLSAGDSNALALYIKGTPSGLTVTGNTVTSGNYGMTFNSLSTSTVSSNNVTGANRGVSTVHFTDVKYTDNTVTATNTNGNYYAAYHGNLTNVEMTGNTFTGGAYAISASAVSSSTIQDNTVTGAKRALSTTGWTNVNCTGNTLAVTEATSDYNALLNGTISGSVISSNTITGSNYSISAIALNNSAVTGNTMATNTTGTKQYAINLSTAADSEISDNTINHAVYGLFINSTVSSVTVQGNTITPTVAGVYINYGGTGNDTKVLDNNISVSGAGNTYGISLGHTNEANSVVAGNTIDGAKYGIYYLRGINGAVIQSNTITNTTTGFYSHTTTTGLEISGNNVDTATTGFWINGTVNTVTVNGNTVRNVTGYAVNFNYGGTGQNIIIADNFIRNAAGGLNLYSRPITSMTVTGNDIGGNGAGTEGIHLNNNQQNSNIHIADNEIHDGFAAAAIEAWNGDNMTIVDNDIHDIAGNGIHLCAHYATGDTETLNNVEIGRNLIQDVARAGILLWTNRNETGGGSNVRIVDNLIANTGTNQVAWYDTAIQVVSSKGSYIYNNTIVGNPQGGISIREAEPVTHDVSVFNNIFSIAGGTGTVYAVLVDQAVISQTSPAPLTMDYNDLYAHSSAQTGVWGMDTSNPLTSGTVCATLAQWQAASGQDANSIASDPDFVDPATGNYQLQPNPSPCVDAGDPATGTSIVGVIDLDGNERLYLVIDIGALESAHKGDGDRNEEVDVLDLARLANNFGKEPAVWNDCDFDFSGKVDVLDLAILANNFGWKATGGAGGDAPVPEPASAALIALGFVVLARRRRRR